MTEKKPNEIFSRVLGKGSARSARKYFIRFFLVIIFFVFLFFIPPKHNLADIKAVKIARQTVKVDLALTKEAQEKGLSGREGLQNDEGLLFVFEYPDNYLFWMKDMNFPIDIIWLNQDRQIVYIKKDAQPLLYPETYGPQKNQPDAKYVLEVASGFSDKNNLQVGDKVEFAY
ncbi:MAG: DUF192 domain-containing protein [Patescibacteria group bacterium]